MDRFDTLQAFARVVEAGSFTKAAQTLNMSKTTVSQLVQQLEARLRVKLLNRTTRQVQVTPEGAAYYERVVRLLGDLEDARQCTGRRPRPHRGAPAHRCAQPVRALHTRCRRCRNSTARYPEIQIIMGVSDRMVDVIGENVDCVVRGGELTDQSLMARRVGDLQLGVCAAPSYLERAGTPSHPRELEDTHHRIVGFLWSRTGKAFPYAMHRDGERVEVQGRHVFSVDDGNAYLAAGLAGLGILWLPDYMARAHLARGELVPLFEDWCLDPMPLYVAFPPNRHVSAKLRVFIDWIAELMAEHAPVIVRPLG
jgi:DNA-binding transcriptional LysR family regulator